MYERGNVISAAEIKALKAEVKAEMLRRNKTGSLSAYGGTSWDFSVTPATGVKIEDEHFDKIKTPVSKINTTGLPSVSNDKFPALDGLNGKLQTYKSYAGKTSTTHGCAASCSGLCYNSCTSCTSCSGCSGCGSGCASDCDGCDGCSGCGTACTYCTGCGSGCADGCDGCDGCSGCGSGCATSCSGCGSGCSNRCDSSCTSCSGCTGCGSGCANGCTGCSGCSGCGGFCDNTCHGCSGSCEGSCSGSCEGKVLFG